MYLMKGFMIFLIFLIHSQHTNSENQLVQIRNSALNELEGSVDDVCLTDLNYCNKDPESYCVSTNGFPECKCKPQYAKVSESDLCQQALTFGGQLHLQPESLLRKRRNTGESEDVEKLLVAAYNNIQGYISVDVVEEVSPGVWSYILYCEIDSEVNKVDISNELEKYLDTSGNCPDNTCTIDGLKVDKDQSVTNAGNNDDLICTSNDDYCDDASTTCTVDGGFVICGCLSGYTAQPGNDRFCEAIICEGNDACNSPFGTCDAKVNSNAGTCNCWFGFNGEHCEDPWLFVSVICSGVLLLSLIITSTIYCCKRSTSKKTKMQNQEYMTKQNHYAELMMKNMEENKNAMRSRANVPANQYYYSGE